MSGPEQDTGLRRRVDLTNSRFIKRLEETSITVNKIKATQTVTAKKVETHMISLLADSAKPVYLELLQTLSAKKQLLSTKI